MIGFQCRAIRKRDLLVDLQDRRVGVRRDQVVEDRRDLGEQLAGALQRRDGVGEVGRGRIVGDRGDLGGMVGEGLLEGRQEVLRRDLVEGRRLERRLPRPSAAGCPASGGGRWFARFLTSQVPFLCLEFDAAHAIARDGAFLGLLRLIVAAFSERLRPSKQDLVHEPTARLRPPPARSSGRASSPSSRRAILIGAEVFGAAFAGGWALAILFGLGDTGAHILQAVLFAIGVLDHDRLHPRGAAHRAVLQARLTRAIQETAAAQAPNALALAREILTSVHLRRRSRAANTS